MLFLLVLYASFARLSSSSGGKGCLTPLGILSFFSKLLFVPIITFFCVYAFYRNCCIIYDPIVTAFVNQTFANPSPAPKNMHLPLSSAVVVDLYICSQHGLFSVCLLDSVDPGQTGPRGLVFVICTVARL